MDVPLSDLDSSPILNANFQATISQRECVVSPQSRNPTPVKLLSHDPTPVNMSSHDPRPVHLYNKTVHTNRLNLEDKLTPEPIDLSVSHIQSRNEENHEHSQGLSSTKQSDMNVYLNDGILMETTRHKQFSVESEQTEIPCDTHSSGSFTQQSEKKCQIQPDKDIGKQSESPESPNIPFVSGISGNQPERFVNPETDGELSSEAESYVDECSFAEDDVMDESCSDVKPLLCDICQQAFEDEADLLTHMAEHSSNMQITCTVCGKFFSQLSSLQTHLLLHTKERPYPCTQCPKSFNRPSNLRDHMLSHTGERPHVCHLCDKSYALSSHLKRHILSHTGEKPYKCRICQQSYDKHSELKSHMVTHQEGESMYKCSMCEKSFLRAHNLERHMSSHQVNLPRKRFNCTLCDKTFTQPANVKRHMMTHTGERPHQCLLCDKAFALAGTLKRHMIMHTEQKQYKCEVCNHGFPEQSDLEQHRLSHVKDRTYTCEVCQKTFSKLYNLQRHAMSHTGEKPYTCKLCDKSFTRAKALKKHMRHHPGSHSCLSDNLSHGRKKRKNSSKKLPQANTHANHMDTTSLTHNMESAKQFSQSVFPNSAMHINYSVFSTSDNISDTTNISHTIDPPSDLSDTDIESEDASSESTLPMNVTLDKELEGSSPSCLTMNIVKRESSERDLISGGALESHTLLAYDKPNTANRTVATCDLLTNVKTEPPNTGGYGGQCTGQEHCDKSGFDQHSGVNSNGQLCVKTEPDSE